MAVLPMFPLGMVLFPGQPLPLHIFEPRYQQLLRDCLAGENEFGVVLIERGREVGGGDTRSDVGTAAVIVDTRELGSGRWAVATVGVRRIRVRSWLDDAPYPRADVEDWPDGDVADPATLANSYTACSAALRRLLALCAEVGVPAAPSTIELADDPIAGSLVLAGLAPLGPFDRQRLLAASDPGHRLALLGSLLGDQRTLLEATLDSDEGPTPY